MFLFLQTQGVNATTYTSPCGFHNSSITETYSEVFEAPCAKRFSSSLEWYLLNDEIDKVNINPL